MDNNVKILLKFSAYFLLFLIIAIIGSSNVFALENNDSIRFYDNNGSSLSYVTTNYVSQTGESSATFTTTANSYGGAVMIQMPYALIQNHIYTIFVSVAAANMGGFTQKSTKNCVGLGNGYNYTINSYVNCNITPKYSQDSGVSADKKNGLYFTFIANTNGAYLLLPYTSQYTCTNCYQYSYGYEISDGGDTSGLSQTEVNNIINSQTTQIQNEIYNMQQAVSGSIDNMTEELIENDKVCNIYDKSNIEIPNKYLNSAGNEVSTSNTNYGISEYIRIGKSTTIKVLNNYTDGDYMCFYNTNKEIISCENQNNYSIDSYITIPTNASYFRYTQKISPNRPQLQICKSSGEELSDQNKEAEKTRKGIFGKLKDLFNLFNSDDIGDSANDGADFINDFDTNTFGLTSIITAPLNLIQSLTSSSCSDLQLPLPYLDNKYLILPCMTTIYSTHFGAFFSIYQTITYGIIAYWVCVRIFNQVKDFKNPEHDEIEVVDL